MPTNAITTRRVPSRRERCLTLWIWLAALIALIGIVAVVVGVRLTPPGPQTRTTSATRRSATTARTRTFTVHITLNAVSKVTTAAEADAGLPGTNVIISDLSGDLLGSATISQGDVAPDHTGTAEIDVTGIPVGKGTYHVTFDRFFGTRSFTEQELRAPSGIEFLACCIQVP